MNFLYSQNNAKFHIVLSGKQCPDLYTNLSPNTLQTIPYTPTAILQPNEWFTIDLTTLPTVKNPIDALDQAVKTTLPTINKMQYQHIKYVVFKRSQDDFYYIQRVLPSAKVYGKTFLTFSSQPTAIADPLIILSEQADAIYYPKTQILYFKDLSSMNGIFKNINILYRTATTQEVQTFFQLGGLLAVDAAYTVEKVGIPNRKNIAKALDTYNNHSSKIKNDLHTYIKTLGLPTDSKGKYIIHNEESLKNFIFAIQERFYTTQASTEKRLAQAYIPI